MAAQLNVERDWANVGSSASSERVAQSVEQQTFNLWVVGSIPTSLNSKSRVKTGMRRPCQPCPVNLMPLFQKMSATGDPTTPVTRTPT